MLWKLLLQPPHNYDETKGYKSEKLFTISHMPHLFGGMYKVIDFGDA